jgi:hypothetical protein
MRIQLTETQFALVARINESVNVSERIKSAIKESGEGADKLYNIITFTTVAEFRDGDTDLGVVGQRVESLSDMVTKLSRKVTDFEQRNMDKEGNWYNPKLKELWEDMDLSIHHLNLKISALDELVRVLKPLSRIDEYGDGREKDIHSPFSNITPTDIR